VDPEAISCLLVPYNQGDIDVGGNSEAHSMVKYIDNSLDKTWEYRTVFDSASSKEPWKRRGL